MASSDESSPWVVASEYASRMASEYGSSFPQEFREELYEKVLLGLAARMPLFSQMPDPDREAFARAIAIKKKCDILRKIAARKKPSRDPGLRDAIGDEDDFDIPVRDHQALIYLKEAAREFDAQHPGPALAQKYLEVLLNAGTASRRRMSEVTGLGRKVCSALIECFEKFLRNNGFF